MTDIYPPVFVNGRFTRQVVTGVQRYSWEITNRLQGRLDLVLPGKFASLPGGVGHLWEQIYLPTQLPKNALLWSPAGAGPLLVSRQIVTVHDIAHLEHPEWFSPNFVKWYRWLLPKLAKKATHLLTVSEFSKHRMVEFLEIAPEKITVVPCGVDSRFFEVDKKNVETIRKKYNLQGDYLLAVSAISPRKNFHRIFKAWEKVSKQLEGISLVITGQAGLSFAGEVNINAIPKGALFTGYIPEEDLPALYSGAHGFIYPSLYEGFGLPILEAMAAGTPVVTSRTTSMPEVAGNAAVYVDPYDIDSIAEGIYEIATNSALRNKLYTEGLKRAQQYSWNNSASLIWEVLRKYS